MEKIEKIMSRVNAGMQLAVSALLLGFGTMLAFNGGLFVMLGIVFIVGGILLAVATADEYAREGGEQ